MRPWGTFSAGKVDEYDYSSLANALQPDWDLLDEHHRQQDFDEQYGGSTVNKQHGLLASAVLGYHAKTRAAQAGRPMAEAEFAPVRPVTLDERCRKRRDYCLVQCLHHIGKRRRFDNFGPHRRCMRECMHAGGCEDY